MLQMIIMITLHDNWYNRGNKESLFHALADLHAIYSQLLFFTDSSSNLLLADTKHYHYVRFL